MPILMRLYIVLRELVLPLVLVLMLVFILGVGLIWMSWDGVMCIDATNPESRGCDPFPVEEIDEKKER